MELRQLECFVAVAEELHFGRAAARLRMTQPPLSRQVQMLEQDLGVTLLERHSRVVKLTAAGHRLLQDARHLLDYAARAALAARRAANGEAGHLTLGYTAVAAYRLMPALLMRAQAVLPEVDIQLREMVSADLARLLQAGELDVVLTRHVPMHQGLQKRLIDREALILALPAGSPLTAMESVPLRALHQQPLILYSPSDSRYFHDRIVGAMGLANISPRYVQRASQTHTLVALVRAGLGYGIVPDSARELHFEGVEYRPISQKNFYADIYLAWRQQSDNPAVEAFLDRVAGRKDQTEDAEALFE
ncbi:MULTISPECIES: LysR family transcriptional regulator [unclassified Bordetella]|uniref:LysR family transcriptional regulator n=1 Tax=unclassified Bordetella TaxID=2630031 RepID=UPI00132839F2|nr:MULTISPECIES: LysR family transcriptional regulator [unclassified Bordetella]MVW72046.1 LysR family transcriptional regulator [Bordetella sp. 15P40C-2]MVW78759.1 LysR family transcriptional regulator [Bordetella sp. 02P26C-1]